MAKQAFITEDGKVFDSKKEADDYERLPKVRGALGPICNNNEELMDWLIENQEDVENAFDTGSIRRVTKKHKKQMLKDFEVVLSNLDADMIPFIHENHDQFMESFRWPAVKRLSEEEKATAAKVEILKLTDNNEELANFVATNRSKIQEAYDAGKVKRQVSEKAKAALEEYRARQRAEKG